MTHAGALLALPHVYATLQFAFRLESFVLVGVSATMLAALVAMRRPPPQPKGWHRLLLPWHWLLVPLALLSTIGALEQVGAHDRLRPRSTALASYATPTYEHEGLLNYVDDELPILRKPLPQVRFAPSPAPGMRLVARVPAGARRRVDSNLRAGPDFLRLEGARIVGTDAHADDVLELTEAHPATIAVSPGGSLPIVAGRWLSLAALLVLAATLGALALRSAPLRRLWSALDDRPRRQASTTR